MGLKGLTTSKVESDIIGISKLRLKRNKQHTTSIDLSNYNSEHCDAAGTNGETLLYLKNDIAYKLRNDLKIYKSKNLESSFIEIINQQNKNIILS